MLLLLLKGELALVLCDDVTMPPPGIGLPSSNRCMKYDDGCCGLEGEFVFQWKNLQAFEAQL